ncbi:MAG TPA: serine hydrolase domain-containing protein [Nevskiaceae bacterium]
MNEALDRALDEATRSGRVAGVAAAVADDHRTLHERAAGVRQLGKPAPMTMDSVFWLASMTKPVTAVAVMQLVEQGRLRLDAPAAEVVPALARTQVLEGFGADGQPILRPPRRAITLRMLLSHTSGFSYVFLNANLQRFKQLTGQPDVVSGRKAMLEAPLVVDPGTRWEYGIGVDWAGQMLEAVTGATLGEYLEEHVLGPLGMADTGFSLRPDMQARLAGIHVRLPDGTLAFHPVERPQPEFQGGGGDLFSTPRDYLRLLRMLLGGGTLDGVRILKQETVHEMGRNQIGELMVLPTRSVIPPLWNAEARGLGLLPGTPSKYGLAFQINVEPTPQGRSAGSLAWAGLTNTYFWIDPTRRLTGVLMTQTLPFLDAGAVGCFENFEAAAYQAFGRA